MSMRSFDGRFKTPRDLMVWYKGHDLVTGIEVNERSELTVADKLQVSPSLPGLLCL